MCSAPVAEGKNKKNDDKKKPLVGNEVMKDVTPSEALMLVSLYLF